MKHDPIEVGVRYYTAIHEHSIEGVERCLHPDVEFKGPFDARKGKSGVLQAAQGFMSIVK